MKTSTVFWSLVVNSLLFLMFRHCYYSLEDNSNITLFCFAVLLANWGIGLFYVVNQFQEIGDTREEIFKTILNSTFFLTSSVTLGSFALIILTIYGIYTVSKKSINKINKLLDS